MMRMRVMMMIPLMLGMLAQGGAQTFDSVSPTQLQSVTNLPLAEAVKAREIYKRPLKAAYARQMGIAGADCKTVQGQQPYNVCMGKASELANEDFAVFYRNLQMLCHDQSQLTSLQASERSWEAYKASTIKATAAVWVGGTAASGVVSKVSLSLVRDYMSQLEEIYALNISQ